METGRYTVTRMNSTQVKVDAPKSRARYLYTVGVKPTCQCPKTGDCGHVLAVMEFIAQEKVVVVGQVAFA